MRQVAEPVWADSRLADLLAARGQPETYLDGLAALYRERVGWTMLTLMTFDLESRLARRVYTSDPVNYPTSQAKPMTESDWAERVLMRGETFVAASPQEFAPHFVDWEKLRGLGMESAANFPAVVGGVTLGTVNLTAGPAFYTPERVAAGRALAPLAALGFFLIERAAREG